MAQAVATLTAYPFPNGVDNTQRRHIYTGLLTFSGAGAGTYVTNGIPLTFFPLGGPEGNIFPVTTNASPIPVEAVFCVINGLPVYDYFWDKTHGTVRIASYATGAELANGAAVTVSDQVQFHVEYPKG